MSEPQVFAVNAITKPAFTDYVIPQLLAWRGAGIGCALVTLVGVEGTSPRPPGSQLAVNEHGDFVGEISSGCAEAALVTEARLAIGDGLTRVGRYGANSKYIDVVLPCGSGIDVHFDPSIDTEALRGIEAARAARRATALLLRRGGGGRSEPCDPATTPAAGHVVRIYHPPLRLVICGRGATVASLAQFAHQIGLDVVVYSPDARTLQAVRPLASEAIELRRPEAFTSSRVDDRTALVTLFHDHDWELPVFLACAERPPLYMGALGSRRAHAARIAALRSAGCKAEFVNAIRGPVGLDIGARSPPEIALSIAGEILALNRDRLLVSGDLAA